MNYQRVSSTTEIGEIIRALRKRAGIRQDDMAAIVGRSHVNLRDVEKGKPSVAIGTVLHLLDELGVRVYLDIPS
jgi:transcriptional regulator with XRE-family HTH domain